MIIHYYAYDYALHDLNSKKTNSDDEDFAHLDVLFNLQKNVDVLTICPFR